jgi:hypothetical protein
MREHRFGACTTQYEMRRLRHQLSSRYALDFWASGLRLERSRVLFCRVIAAGGLAFSVGCYRSFFTRVRSAKPKVIGVAH